MNIDPAILGVAGAGVLQVIGVAFWLGMLTARVRNLEKQQEPMLTLATSVAVTGGEIKTIREEMRLLNQELAWMRKPASIGSVKG